MKINKKLRAALVTVLTLTLIFTMSGFAFAGTGDLTLSEAYDKALKDAGLTKSDVKRVEKEFDREDQIFEIEFTRKGTKIEYDYEISKSGKILEKSVDYNRARVKGKKKLTKSQAVAKLAKFSGIKKSVINEGKIRLEKDDGQWQYEIKFKKGGYRYEYDVHARTGKILEYSRKAV